MKLHKNTSPGGIAISKLSRIKLVELIRQEDYIIKASEKYGISQSAVTNQLRRRMDKLKVFIPLKGNGSDNTFQKHPFSTNEDDYGTRRFARKLENSPILPQHNELTEVVEWYKLSIMPVI